MYTVKMVDKWGDLKTTLNPVPQQDTVRDYMSALNSTRNGSTIVPKSSAENKSKQQSPRTHTAGNNSG